METTPGMGSSSAAARGATWTGGVSSGVKVVAVATVVVGFEAVVVVTDDADDHQSFFSTNVSFLV